MKNYLFFGGRLFLRYVYVDRMLNDHFAADSLFYRNKVPVIFGKTMAKKDGEFCLVFCRIRRKYIKQFEKALGELSGKMALLGYAGYDDVCAELMKMAGDADPAGQRRQSAEEKRERLLRRIDAIDKVFGEESTES